MERRKVGNVFLLRCSKLVVITSGFEWVIIIGGHYVVVLTFVGVDANIVHETNANEHQGLQRLPWKRKLQKEWNYSNKQMFIIRIGFCLEDDHHEPHTRDVIKNVLCLILIIPNNVTQENTCPIICL